MSQGTIRHHFPWQTWGGAQVSVCNVQLSSLNDLDICIWPLFRTVIFWILKDFLASSWQSKTNALSGIFWHRSIGTWLLLDPLENWLYRGLKCFPFRKSNILLTGKDPISFQDPVFWCSVIRLAPYIVGFHNSSNHYPDANLAPNCLFFFKRCVMCPTLRQLWLSLNLFISGSKMQSGGPSICV